MNKKNIKISFILNIITVILTLIATIIMFTGFKFMTGYDVVLESSRIGMFKFFTVDSNLLMGVVALIFAIKEYKILEGKIEDISTRYYILKLASTTSVSLTFIVVFAYLGPISKHGIYSMLQNSNLFFHLLIPVISIINFIAFEKTDKIKIKYSLYGLIPTVLYSIFYLTNVLIHMENGKVDPIYDWYWFVQNGVWSTIIILPLMWLISYFITFALWKNNKKNK